MPHFYVSRDREGSYERAVTSETAESAVQEWAEWYCHRSAEFPSQFECFLRERHGEPEAFLVTIESVPVFYASKL